MFYTFFILSIILIKNTAINIYGYTIVYIDELDLGFNGHTLMSFNCYRK
jgi:hypothetical protein